MHGANSLLIEARLALLDAMEALAPHRESVILIGAQAIFLRTGRATFALAEATKDSDIAVDPRQLGEDPRIEEAMTRAGFELNPISRQPGAWLSPSGIPVDLMVPELLAGAGSRRGIRIPPHSTHAARRTAGLEAALVDQSLMTVHSLNDDGRSVDMRVAGSAALLVAKLHKLGERASSPSRLSDKDAHDIYRLLVATDTRGLASTFERLRTEAISEPAATQALTYLKHLFSMPSDLGAMMAGRAETGIGQPEVVSVSASLLAQDLLSALT